MTGTDAAGCEQGEHVGLVQEADDDIRPAGQDGAAQARRRPSIVGWRRGRSLRGAGRAKADPRHSGASG